MGRDKANGLREGSPPCVVVLPRRSTALRRKTLREPSAAIVGTTGTLRTGRKPPTSFWIFQTNGWRREPARVAAGSRYYAPLRKASQLAVFPMLVVHDMSA